MEDIESWTCATADSKLDLHVEFTMDSAKVCIKPFTNRRHKSMESCHGMLVPSQSSTIKNDNQERSDCFRTSCFLKQQNVLRIHSEPRS